MYSFTNWIDEHDDCFTCSFDNNGQIPGSVLQVLIWLDLQSKCYETDTESTVPVQSIRWSTRNVKMWPDRREEFVDDFGPSLEGGRVQMGLRVEIRALVSHRVGCRCQEIRFESQVVVLG